MAKLSPEELLNDLAQFTGTTKWFFHPTFPKFRYTEGVRYLAVHAECYWLLEFIFSNQLLPEVKAQPFQVWKISVGENSKAKIWVEDGNYNIVKEFEIPFTDFPLQSFTAWFVDNTLLLPSEY